MAKVILYMAISIDGFIARADDNTDWVSTEEWESYSQHVIDAGNMIIGHRTYDILVKQPEFKELEDLKIVIVSSKKFPTASPNHVIAHSPKDALALLSNFETVIVAGGGMLNHSFLKQKLIDEIFVDIEPIILGEGIKLCGGENTETRLTLIDTKKISDSVIQIHYKVLNSSLT